MSGPEQLHISFREQNVDYDIALVKDGKSAYTVKINGINYAVLGDEEKLKRACEIFNSVSLNLISNSDDLKGRLASREDISFPAKKIDHIGVKVLGTKPLTISSNESSSKMEAARSTWLDAEDNAVVKEIPAVAAAYWKKNGDKGDHRGLMNYLKERLVGGEQIHLITEFESALDEKNEAKFIALFKQVPRAFVDDIEGMANLGVLPNRRFTENREFTDKDKSDLADYMRATGFSGVVSITSAKRGQLAVKTERIANLDAPFAMQSVGKAFTGMLLMTVMQKGIISEEMIDLPLQLQLEEHVLKQLYDKGIPKEALENITLRQVMQHTSGLGDYLDNYLAAIKKALDAGLPPPDIEKPEDLLGFADGTIKTLREGEYRYSNLGSLLFGLSIQNHYNKELIFNIKKAEQDIQRLKSERDKIGSEPSEIEAKKSLNLKIQMNEEHLLKLKSSYVPYSEILRREIIEPAKLGSFSEKRPPNAHCVPNDPTDDIYGGPAGGYWITVKDLDKFGQWICQQYKLEAVQAVHPETSLPQLLQKYGGEFCKDSGTRIDHNGAVPSGSGHFAAYLTKDVTVAVLSDQKRLRGNIAADGLHYSIFQNLLTEEEVTAGSSTAPSTSAPSLP